MNIQIANSGQTIKITENGGSFYIPKPYLVKSVLSAEQPNNITTEGRLVIQYSQGDENREWTATWTDITLPVVESLQEMVDAINNFQN
jgi:hypothetical protein